MKNKEKIIKYSLFIILSIGLVVCIAVLFPQIRQMIIELAEQITHKKTSINQELHRTLLSVAIGGIIIIVIFGYCLLTASGKMLVCKVKNEIRDCLTEINWQSFIKPVLLMFGIYLLGILTVIRANFMYLDDVGRSAQGYRGWYDWSRYISEFLSVLIHADFHLTDISPLPQLLAILFLAVSSVLLVYVLNNKKIMIIGFLACIPLGLSPYMLENLSFKFDAPYMALSVLASIVPFLFLAHNKAFVFCSIISMLVMCMTYQVASGIYPIITLVLCFNDWNGKRKTNREIFLFLGKAILSFCVAMVIFKLFMYFPRPTIPISQMISGIWTNLQTYTNTINNDFGLIWKVVFGIIICFFIVKSFRTSVQNKMISFLAAILLLCLLFVLSYGVYLALSQPLFAPRAMYGFGVLLAIISIYIVSEFDSKTAKIFTLALSWSFFVFAFSYGNALADQLRYANFRITILLQDLSALYPDKDKDENKITIQLKNTIGYTPVVKNIAIHNPVIYRLVPQKLSENSVWDDFYYLDYFNFASFQATANLKRTTKDNESYIDFNTMDLPVVLKTYYHTIRSDGKHVLVELNEGVK